MKILSMSGGATRFIGIAAAAIKVIEKGYRPDVILGVSAGAIASIPLALGLFNDIVNVGENLTPDQFFVKGKHPMTRQGKIKTNALWRVFCGAISLGEQDVRPLLRKVITEELWLKYKNGNYPNCIVFAVDAYRGSVKYWNLKECATREDAFNRIEASSRIAPIVNPMCITENGKLDCYVDGGFRVHNPAGYYLRKNPQLQVTDLVSIYSRPKNNDTSNPHWADNFFNVTSRMIEIATTEVSKANELEEIDQMEDRGGKHTIIFLPNILSETYETGENLVKLKIESQILAEIEYNKTYNA